ncbi:Serine/threonine-protein kinase pkn1 [termite gut metagenome]|uniref:Serine/threonine-protein kinase pkn1 n=1 Tax=termite gut metagenome TaxID=433724 RepID=A0A5J4RTI5_9ZZZZ
MKKYIILAMQKVLGGWFIGMFFLVACTEDEGQISKDKVITFSSNLSGIASRVDSQDFIYTKERWLEDDAIGVFYINGEVLSEESIINGVRNSKYVSTRQGENTIFTSVGDKFYYSNNDKPNSFLAYYPYTTNLLVVNGSFLYPIDITNQSDPSKMDLLYAVTSGDESLDNAIVPLTFKHQLSKLVLNISDTYYDSMEVTATGFYTKAIFSLVDRSITGYAGDLDVIDVKVGLHGLQIEMLVIPQKVSNGLMSFDLAGNKAKWNIPNKEFEAGKKYEYSLRFDFPEIEVSGELITEWEAGGQYPVDTEKPDTKIDIIDNLLVKIPGNTYLIGSPQGMGLSNEYPQHQAGIGTFWIIPYEITNEQYALFLNAYENGIKDPPIIIVDGHELLSDTVGTVGVWFDSSNHTWYSKEGRESYPITNVTWYGARAFAHWLGGDLPTEREWEAVCRVEDMEGKSLFSFDNPRNTMNDILGYVNCKEKAKLGTIPVKSLKPTKYGLYNMHGNVSEWCLDAVERSADGSSVAPYYQGNIILEQSEYHIIRGGGWRSPLEQCRSASRDCLLPTQALDDVGFRVAFPIKNILNVTAKNLENLQNVISLVEKK